MPYAPKPLPRPRSACFRPDNRPTCRQRGYDRDWEKLRGAVIEDEPLCRACNARQVVRAADVVDHIRPIVDGGARLDRANLQPLCRKCHAEKTAEDIRKRRSTMKTVAALAVLIACLIVVGCEPKVYVNVEGNKEAPGVRKPHLPRFETPRNEQ